MDIAIAIVIGVLLTGALLWRLLQPSPETAMGQENRARREARKAEKKRAKTEPACQSATKASRREEGPRALRPSR
ncbi:MAG: hypothetical protein QOH48_1729 [Actinomycetota bacterium]|jgi:hypothetical protein|nr:hypothetical protein [Actinomycetota bacterium]